MLTDSSSLYLSELRVIHNRKDIPAINVYLDNKPLVINLGYQSYMAYLIIDDGEYEIKVKIAGNEESIICTHVSLKYDKSYTLIIMDDIYEIFQDNSNCLNDEYAYVRFFHQTVDIDIYLNNIKVISNLNHIMSSIYYPVKVGQNLHDHPYHICTKITPPDSSIILASASLYLMKGDIYTLVTSQTMNDKLQILYIHDNKNEFEELQNDFVIKLFRGRWYYICYISQEIMCPHETIDYELTKEKIDIYHNTYDKNWNITSSTNKTAIVINPYEPAILEINSSQGSQIPNKTICLIHKTNYVKYAVIGSRDRKTLYILSRTPKMCVNDYVTLINYAKSIGYHKYLIKNYYLALTELGCK